MSVYPCNEEIEVSLLVSNPGGIKCQWMKHEATNSTASVVSAIAGTC